MYICTSDGDSLYTVSQNTFRCMHNRVTTTIRFIVTITCAVYNKAGRCYNSLLLLLFPIKSMNNENSQLLGGSSRETIKWHISLLPENRHNKATNPLSVHPFLFAVIHCISHPVHHGSNPERLSNL